MSSNRSRSLDARSQRRQRPNRWEVACIHALDGGRRLFFFQSGSRHGSGGFVAEWRDLAIGSQIVLKRGRWWSYPTPTVTIVSGHTNYVPNIPKVTRGTHFYYGLTHRDRRTGYSYLRQRSRGTKLRTFDDPDHPSIDP